MKKTEKCFIMMVFIIIMAIGFTACGSDKQAIKGTYLSEDGNTMLVSDSEVIFIVQGDNITAVNYTINGDALIVGEDIYYFDGEEKESLTIGSEIYTKTSCPLPVRWKLVKWSSKYRIETASLGIIQWLILDPIFMAGANQVGHYSMWGSWLALTCVVLFIFIVSIVIYNIRKKKKK